MWCMFLMFPAYSKCITDVNKSIVICCFGTTEISNSLGRELTFTWSNDSKVCAKVLSRLWSCSGQVSVSRIPIETRRTTKDDEEKKRAKGFQGFLYGTSGGRNSKGSSPGPPGRKKNIFFKKKLRRAHTIEKNT